MNNQHNFDIKKIIDQYENTIQKYISIAEQQLTEQLRTRYKNKHVKCICYDMEIDGDCYQFDQKLIDIKAHYEQLDSSLNEFKILVTFLVNMELLDSKILQETTFRLVNMIEIKEN